jgi:hypothetical protein
MNTIYKNNLCLIFLSFLVIISNSSCVDSGIGLQPKNKDIQKITATEEEKKKMFEEMAEKLKAAGSSAEEFSRYYGGEARGSGMARGVTCPETAMRLREMEEEEREQKEARDKALEGAKPINKKEQDELYEKLKEAVRESVRIDKGKGESDVLDISLIEEIFILQREKLRGALKADPYFFHLDRDCFVPDKTLRTKNFEMEDAYLDIVKQYMGYDPFDIVDY